MRKPSGIALLKGGPAHSNQEVRQFSLTIATEEQNRKAFRHLMHLYIKYELEGATAVITLVDKYLILRNGR